MNWWFFENERKYGVVYQLDHKKLNGLCACVESLWKKNQENLQMKSHLFSHGGNVNSPKEMRLPKGILSETSARITAQSVNEGEGNIIS